jgi:hypothetical protein
MSTTQEIVQVLKKSPNKLKGEDDIYLIISDICIPRRFVSKYGVFKNIKTIYLLHFLKRKPSWADSSSSIFP